MRHHYHSFNRLLLVLTSLAFLTSCTLVDNDLRDLPDVPGYADSILVETDEYKCTYQFQDNTILMNERYNQYIDHMDYPYHKLYMHDYTPDEYLPKVGQALAVSQSEKLEYGIFHVVTGITHEGRYYVLSLERATLDTVYKHFTLDLDVDYGEKEEQEDSTATDNLYTRAPKTLENDFSSDWHEFDLLDLLRAKAAIKTKKWKALTFGEFYGTWYKPGCTAIYDEKTNKFVRNDSPWAIYAKAKGQILFRFKIIGKSKCYIDMKQNVLDACCDLGIKVEVIPQVAGTIGVYVDFLKFLDLPDSKSFPIVNPFGLPLFWFIEWGAGLDLSLSGTIGYKFEKTFLLSFGARNNIKGKEDGTYVTNKSSSPKISTQEDIYSFAGENNDLKSEVVAEANGEAWLKGWLGGGLLFGANTEYPNIGVKADISVGPRIKTTFASTSKSSYERVWHFGIPLRLDGYFFFNLFKGIQLDWNFIDAIAKGLGFESGAEVEFAKKDFRVYPSIDNVSVLCTNNKETGTQPKFEISFEVLETGMTPLWRMRPVLRIFPKDGTIPILEIDNQKSLDDTRRFIWKNISNEAIQRDVFYEVEIVWKDKNEYGTDVEKCSKRFTFTSVSPYATITDDEITMQKQYTSTTATQTGSNQVSYKCYYDFIFRTAITFSSLDNITSWGFLIGQKLYRVKQATHHRHVAVRWKINKSKAPREIKITPFVEANGMITYGAPYKVKLKYMDELNSYEHVYERKWGKGWYTSGFDDEKNYINLVDVFDMTEEELP